MPCKFHLVNGETITLPITSVTTAADVVKEIAKKIGLRDHVGWSLYEVSWKNGKPNSSSKSEKDAHCSQQNRLFVVWNTLPT
jgi:hypothetical protein